MNCIPCSMHFALRYALLVGINCLYSCRPVYTPASHHSTLLNIEANRNDTGVISRLIQPFRDSLSTYMDVPLGFAEKPLVKERPAGSLGNFFTDAMLQIARERDPNVKLFISNYGGLRVNRWGEGTIMVKQAYELMPFDNTLVFLDVTGSLLNTWIQHMAKQGGWPIAGACIQTDTLKNHSAFVSCSNGTLEPILPEKTYRIATSDFIAKGGDRCEFLIPLTIDTDGLLLRDALIQYVKKNPRIQPNSQNRFLIQ